MGPSPPYRRSIVCTKYKLTPNWPHVDPKATLLWLMYTEAVSSGLSHQSPPHLATGQMLPCSTMYRFWSVMSSHHRHHWDPNGSRYLFQSSTLLWTRGSRHSVLNFWWQQHKSVWQMMCFIIWQFLSHATSHTMCVILHVLAWSSHIKCPVPEVSSVYADERPIALVSAVTGDYYQESKDSKREHGWLISV